MTCGLEDTSLPGSDSFPNSLRGKCCCICALRYKIHKCKCRSCRDNPSNFDYVCMVFAKEGLAEPATEHGICEGFTPKEKDEHKT